MMWEYDIYYWDPNDILDDVYLTTISAPDKDEARYIAERRFGAGNFNFKEDVHS